MRLTPLDIQHMEFERSVSGYKRGQVRSFLERIATEREDLLKELQSLRDAVAERDERIATLQEAESDLRRAVVSAERVANQIKENARREADLIVREAESGVRDRHADAERAAREAREELARLRNLAGAFRDQFRGMLHAFERSLDARLETFEDAVDAPPARRRVLPPEDEAEEDESVSIGADDLLSR